MRLQCFGSNQTIIHTEDGDVFFSYETPVAAFIPGRGYLRTDSYYSRTTSKHIGLYLQGAQAETVPQEVIDQLLVVRMNDSAQRAVATERTKDIIRLHISFTIKSPHPSSEWTLIHEDMQCYNSMDEAKDFLKKQYFSCKKRVPCYRDTASRGTVQCGWIYCYKEQEDGKTYYRQDWVMVSTGESNVIDVRHTGRRMAT